MKRDIQALRSQVFDVLVIGGGAMGAAIARDAAMRGLSVALVEANDFASATSGASSKLIHGGLRYLQNYEFALVREALAERKIWQEIAAHLVKPLPFLVPLFNLGFFSRLKLRAGLVLYDFLARLGNSDLPSHRWISSAESLSMAPLLHSQGLSGGVVYYDCAMDSPERLCLAMVKSAAANGAVVANYCRQRELLVNDGRVVGITVEDLMTGEVLEVKSSTTINATGPWADLVMKGAFSGIPPTRLMRSKGIHLMTRKFKRDFLALALAANGRHFFLLPWRDDLTIIGTTDVEYDGDPADVSVTEADIAGLLETTNAALPNAKLARSEIVHAYAGLRPLVDDAPAGATNSSYKASRRAEVCDHRQDGLLGFISAIGGKWTTSRKTAEVVVDLIFEHLGRQKTACRTAKTLLPGGGMDWETAAKDLHRGNPGLSDHDAQRLARAYGSEVHDVFCALSKMETPSWPECPHLEAATRYAVAEEMALKLEDVVCRRTVLGVAGDPDGDKLSKVAEIMAEMLGWDEDHTSEQIRAVKSFMAV